MYSVCRVYVECRYAECRYAECMYSIGMYSRLALDNITSVCLLLQREEENNWSAKTNCLLTSDL